MVNELSQSINHPLVPNNRHSLQERKNRERLTKLKSDKMSQERCRVEREGFLRSLTQADRDRVSFITNTFLLFCERIGAEDIALIAQTGFLNETMEPLIFLNAVTSKTQEVVGDMSKNIHGAISEHEEITGKIFKIEEIDGYLDIAETPTAKRIIISCAQTDLHLIDFIDQRAAKDDGACILLNSPMEFITGNLPTPSRHDALLEI